MYYNAKPLLKKKFTLILIIVLKTLNFRRQVELVRMSPSKTRANEVENTPYMNGIF